MGKADGLGFKRSDLGIEPWEDLPNYAWPGGYTIAYFYADGGICCGDCATRHADENAEQTMANLRDGLGFDDATRYHYPIIEAYEVEYESEMDEHCDNCGKLMVEGYKSADDWTEWLQAFPVGTVVTIGAGCAVVITSHVGSTARGHYVGDDREMTFWDGDIRAISEDDYCAECGQIGCAHDGRERD